MADILPFRAWRYNDELSRSIENLTSPLFDVVSSRQRAALYENKINSVHLSVPNGEDPAKLAEETLDQWKKDGTLKQDHVPGIYVYFQKFALPGRDHVYVRKGFICNIRIHDWNENVILRHENTMPHSVSDRQSILASTGLNVSPTHGLYTDTAHEIEALLDESMQNPIYEVEDYQGVTDSLGVIQDSAAIRKIMSVIRDKQIILADGHHRYEGSLAHYKQMRQNNPDHTGEEGYNFHMMYLTNTEAHDLRILPTHRLIKGKPINEEKFLGQLQEDFIVKPVENPFDINEIILGKQWAFGLLINNNAYKIRLKPDQIHQMSWNFPSEVKELDLTVMHYFIFEKILRIPGIEQRSAREISFERSFPACLQEVVSGQADFAIITKDISIDTVKQVCYSGYTMPQKSTYFYPKVICGFLFGSILDHEFHSPFDSSF
ncbi:MAG: DUF1015 domain-containing protein [Cytophagales bacterium]|nr:DUF1015 domain-containing protein [Cytophagales bacterium]